jgi:hypothetical protein
VGSISASVRTDPHYTRHVKGTALEELFTMGEAVESLMGHPGWDYVNRLLDAEIAEIDRSMDDTQEPLSQASYALKHGRRGGLRGAQEAAAAIRDKYLRALEEQQRKHESDAEPSLDRR